MNMISVIENKPVGYVVKNGCYFLFEMPYFITFQPCSDLMI